MRVFRAWRPPPVRATRALERPRSGNANVAMTVAETPVNALRDLGVECLPGAGMQTLLVTAGTPPAWSAGFAQLQAAGGIAVAPAGRHARNVVAAGPLRDFRRVDLTDGAWVRWDFPRSGFLLDHAFMPACIEPPADVLVPAGRAEADSPAALWLDVAHPHTAARIRTAPDQAALLAELLTGLRARFIVHFSTRTPPRAEVAALTDHPVAAQLVWRAAQRMTADRDAPEMPAPWEDSVVQAAAQLGFGPTLGAQLTIHLRDPHGLYPGLAGRLHELLGCEVMSCNCGRGDG